MEHDMSLIAKSRNSSRHCAPAFLDNEARWNAVCRRDTAADGIFFYSVRTTGVYCRPSCGARLARRENVDFFETCADAERAGFRPCKRCRPDGLAPAEQQAVAVATVCRLIEEADEMPGLARMAQVAGLSRYHFHRIFKAVTRLTPKAYADARRGQRVQDELRRSETVTAAIYRAGFNSNSRFYENASHLLGMTPTEFRAGGRDAAIRFAVGDCSLGAILVAATQKGVCAIEFGDDPNALVRALQDRFPKAKLIGADLEFEQLAARAIGLVETPANGFDLPLDVRGTAFQQRVWRALRDIPPGSTASYTVIARRIGHPKAVRAVARACASNPLAVAIPCHRVVRQDGDRSGYRWGVERKEALLKREAVR
jgi:AraC family transcriptional regulator of adaptative response/methylated-DNA-[protein]-cysteine methyltransferase